MTIASEQTRACGSRPSRPTLIGVLRGKTLSALVAVAWALGALPAMASEYTVSPMRMELDREARSTVVTSAVDANARAAASRSFI